MKCNTVLEQVKKNAARGILKKIVFCEILHLTTFEKSWFLALRRGLANLAAAFNITQYHYNIKSCRKKLAVWAIFRKTCNLLNFAFYNFTKILVFSCQERFENFTATQNITWNHFLEPWFSIQARGLANFAAVYYIIVKLL